MREKALKKMGIIMSICICLCIVLSGNSYGWTFRANFDTGDSSSGLSAMLPQTTFYTSSSAGRSITNNKMARVYFLQGSTGSPGSGNGTGGSVTYNSRVYQGGEVWARAFYYFESPWSWTCSPVVKMLRGARIASSSGTHLGYHSIFAGTTGKIILSNEPGSKQTTTGSSWDIGQWQCIEMYVKLHSDTSQSMFRIWKNGQLVIEDSTRTLQNSTDYADFGYIFTYWNGGHPQNQVAYVDDVVFTNETPKNVDSSGNPMIGCGPFPPAISVVQ